MKRMIAAILILPILTVASCSPKKRADELLDAFCKAYPISARIYYSLSEEGEEGYIGDDMLSALFGTNSLPVREFALALYGKVDTVREIGVFISCAADDGATLSELIARRIEFLSAFADGEGFIKKHKRITVYGFVDDPDYAEALFDRII